MSKERDIPRVRIGRHGFVEHGVAIVPDDKGAEPGHGGIGGTATTDNNHGVPARAPQEIDPTDCGLDLSVESTHEITQAIGLKVGDDTRDVSKVGHDQDCRLTRRDSVPSQLRHHDRPGRGALRSRIHNLSHGNGDGESIVDVCYVF
jgi:hypothetical protein